MKGGKRNLAPGRGQDIPPLKKHVEIYFLQKGMSQQQADFFYRQHHRRKWKGNKGQPLKNWKTLACEWIWEYIQAEKTGRNFQGNGSM